MLKNVHKNPHRLYIGKRSTGNRKSSLQVHISFEIHYDRHA